MRPLILVPLVIVATTPLLAQGAATGRPGRRAPLPRAAELALARSAAPASVSGDARVYLFTEGGYVIADSGRSGVACYVNRSWPESLEPSCFDPEGAVTVMPMEMERTLLLHQGRSAEEAERAISEGLMTGRYRLPARPAVQYMMSSGQRLVSDDGQPRGAWRPHLMIHYPFLTGQALGHGARPDLDAGIVVDSGRPTSVYLVVVPRFVAPGATRDSTR
jgi:hypothetical protein